MACSIPFGQACPLRIGMGRRAVCSTRLSFRGTLRNAHSFGCSSSLALTAGYCAALGLAAAFIDGIVVLHIGKRRELCINLLISLPCLHEVLVRKVVGNADHRKRPPLHTVNKFFQSLDKVLISLTFTLLFVICNTGHTGNAAAVFQLRQIGTELLTVIIACEAARKKAQQTLLQHSTHGAGRIPFPVP